MRIISLLAMVVLLASCSTSKSVTDQGGKDGIVGKKWQLIELDGKKVAEKVNGKMPSLEFSKDKSLYSAEGGCNVMNGKYTLSAGGKIKFGQGMATMMACQDMTIEDGMKKMMAEVDSYMLDGDMLHLHAGATVKAVFKLVSADTNALAGEWELDYIADTSSDFGKFFPNKKPTIKFDVAGKKVNGNGSCNNFFGALKVDGHKMTIAQVGATKMACLDGGNGETVFFQHLDRVTSFSEADGVLTLIADDIAIMRFHKKS